MSADDVTPIRSGGGPHQQPAKPPRKPRAPRAKAGLLLRESGEDDGFSTLDVVNGLRGVCQAGDSLVVSVNAIDLANDLFMAAKILSSILADRVEI